jgi:SAM-dependent methyltransferase
VQLDSVNGGDHPALQGDIAFHFDLARRAGGEALEIGVGTGRVAVELAKAGIHVTGVDLSAAMLAIGAEKAAALELADRLRLECVDMRGIDLAKQEFGLVIHARAEHRRHCRLRRGEMRGAIITILERYCPEALA